MRLLDFILSVHSICIKLGGRQGELDKVGELGITQQQSWPDSEKSNDTPSKSKEFICIDDDLMEAKGEPNCWESGIRTV
jgi:hypothetical protein